MPDERHLARCLEAVRRAAATVDVPGTPRSLRLDTSGAEGDTIRLTWSFIDPEDPGPAGGHRIREVLRVSSEPGDPDHLARSWWAEVQLSAGRRYKSQIDADWTPGAPYSPRTWTPDEAWQALIDHLGAYGADLRAEAREIRVRSRGEETVYRIDPEEWAAFLNAVDSRDDWDDSDIVPVATPAPYGGLPMWAIDDLDETAGSRGPVIGLVDGRLVGLGRPDE
ncbi:MAG TPA: hypothetical protein VFO49_03685 [Nocardioides sp.]|nr:hypothetical protein [Nocardioides sp.]